MRAAIVEGDARAGHEVAHRPAHERLARAGERGDPRGDVDRHAAHVVAEQLRLARVHAGADLDAEPAHGARDRGGAPDRARRTVEHGEEPVAHRLDLATAVVGELLAHDAVVLVQELAPAAVAERRRQLRGADDVGEQQGQQRAGRLRRPPRSRHELLDLPDHPLGVADGKGMVSSLELHEPGVGDQLCQPAGGPTGTRSSRRWRISVGT